MKLNQRTNNHFMHETVNNLIKLKKQQILSLEAGDWDKVHALEKRFKSLLSPFELKEVNFSHDNSESIQELIYLNNFVTQQALLQRDTVFQQLIEIKKGKTAAKAYLDRA